MYEISFQFWGHEIQDDDALCNFTRPTLVHVAAAQAAGLHPRELCRSHKLYRAAPTQ